MKKVHLLLELFGKFPGLGVVKFSLEFVDFCETCSTNQEQKHYIFVRYNILVGVVTY